MTDMGEAIADIRKTAREVGFARGVSAVCRLLSFREDHDLAIQLVKDLIATDLADRLASLDFDEREELLKEYFAGGKP